MDTPGSEPEVDLTDFERRLGRLRPAAVAIDRDRMLFEAGRASARAGWTGRLAPSIAALALVSVALGGLLARERQERRLLEVTIAARSREAAPPAPIASPDPRPIEPSSYLALTRQILAGDLDQPPSRAAEPPASDRPESPLRVRGPGGLIDL